MSTEDQQPDWHSMTPEDFGRSTVELQQSLFPERDGCGTGDLLDAE